MKQLGVELRHMESENKDLKARIERQEAFHKRRMEKEKKEKRALSGVGPTARAPAPVGGTVTSGETGEKMERMSDTQADKYPGRRMDRQAGNRHADRQTDRHAGRRVDRQDRQTDRKAGRQAGRQDRQTDGQDR